VRRLLRIDPMRAGLIAIVLLGMAGSAEAGNGIFVPPSRVDFSPATMTSGDGPMGGFHFLGGLYWASLWPGKRTPVDVGIGYLYEAYDTGASGRPKLLASGLALDPDPVMSLHGTFLELARRAGGHGGERRWLGARAELLFGEVNGHTRTGVGFTGRAAWELFAPVKAGGNGGGIIGTFALGVYAEVSGRLLPDGRGAVQSTGGLSFRVPLIAIGG